MSDRPQPDTPSQTPAAASLAADLGQATGRLDGLLYAIRHGAPAPPLLDAIESELETLAALAAGVALLERRDYHRRTGRRAPLVRAAGITEDE